MTLKDVLLDGLRSLYNAETQLTEALPKLAKGANDAELKKAFKEHLAQTEAQILRLREAFQIIEKKAKGKRCRGIEGVIAEGSEALKEDAKGASFDSGLISAALRTEYYEIASYHACIAMANTLGLGNVAELLNQNLQEELAAARKLEASGKLIFKQAIQEEAKDSKPAPDKTSAKKSEINRKKPVSKTSKKKAA